ncbi:hypothetical protein FACS1894108_05440 [Planctomycetales bacterium]|nr:hypothetical protein FACS1894108_05440 [Planctomycetales bacterium]
MFWSLKIDKLSTLADFRPDDGDEVIIDLDAAPLPELLTYLQAEHFPAEKIRVALPLITRTAALSGDEVEEVARRIKILRAAGWQKFLAAQLGQLPWLNGADIAADWSLYAANSAAIEFLRGQGVRRFTASPEDDAENLRALLAGAGDALQVIVYQDSPLFIAEPCARAAWQKCPCHGEPCNGEPQPLATRGGQKFALLTDRCRSTVINDAPFSWSEHLPQLRDYGLQKARVDFTYRRYESAAAKILWQRIKNGETLAGTHSGNFRRGWQ